MFAPEASFGQALDLLQDYDRHAEIFSPAIARSKLVSSNGDVFRVDLRFYMKKVSRSRWRGRAKCLRASSSARCARPPSYPATGLGIHIP